MRGGTVMKFRGTLFFYLATSQAFFTIAKAPMHFESLCNNNNSLAATGVMCGPIPKDNTTDCENACLAKDNSKKIRMDLLVSTWSVKHE